MVRVTKLERVMECPDLALELRINRGVDQPGWMRPVNLSLALLQGELKVAPDKDLCFGSSPFTLQAQVRVANQVNSACPSYMIKPFSKVYLKFTSASRFVMM